MKILTILSVLALTMGACSSPNTENNVRDGGHGIGIDTETVNQIQQSADSIDASL